MPRISLCMIVKDEERFLPACLESVRGAVDEVVIVDTGSRDQTRAIARAAGAKLVDFEWCDDFAAARNAGLERASGTHVLVLDADERLGRGAARALRKASADATLGVGLLPLHDATRLDAGVEDVIGGAQRLVNPVWVARFFQNDPRLRFVRRVHETLPFDLGRTLAALHARIAPVDAPIAHYGEVKQLRAERGKAARNTRLLELALQDDPSDGDLAGYLALEHFRAGDRAAAEAVAERHLPAFLAAIDATPAGWLKRSPVQLAGVLATCRLQSGAAQAALECLHAAGQRTVEPHPNLRFLEGVALEQLGRVDEAERAFRDCLAMDERRYTIPVNPGATDAAPRLRLANLFVMQSRAGEALELLQAVPADAGKFDLPAQLLRAEALLVGGDPGAALKMLGPLLTRAAPPPDLFALAAAAARALGHVEQSLVDAAHRAEHHAWLEPRRRALA